MKLKNVVELDAAEIRNAINNYVREKTGCMAGDMSIVAVGNTSPSSMEFARLTVELHVIPEGAKK